MLDLVKSLLGIDDPYNIDFDLKLNAIIEMTSTRLINLLGGIEKLPPELEYIVVEVSIIRFNRIGSEGLSSHSMEGESLTFNDDDFSAYTNDIQAYLERQKDGKRGKVRFL